MSQGSDLQPSILMVDDEPIILMSLRQELRKNLGDMYRYITATNGESGLEIIETFQKEGIKIILIVSDWLMPEMKGDTFIRKVRDRHPHIRTIMLSGMADEAIITQLLNEGSLDAYLPKPWNTSELTQTCKKLIDS